MNTLLIIESGRTSLRYTLVDVERELSLGRGLIEGIGADAATIMHEVRRIGAPGEPAPTVLGVTFRSTRPVADDDEAIAAMRAQFFEHGPQLSDDVDIVRRALDTDDGS